MIVRNINTIKNAIGVNAGFNYDDIKPYVKRAERKFLIPLIGKEQYDVFNAATPPVIGDGEELFTAFELAQDAISNLAYYLGLPVLQVQISSAGIFVPENQETRPASDKHFKELQRSFKSAGFEAIDALLDYMETNNAEFTEWTADDSYTEFKELLVYNTTTFQKEYNINSSRLTFLALVPNIKTVEDQYICGAIGAELLKAIKEPQTEDVRIQAKKYLIKSIVAFTVYKTVDNGLFRMEPDGMALRFDVLPYEKVFTNSSTKINDFLINTKRNKLNEGEEYLKMALAIISNPDNANDFTEYTPKTATADKISMVKTQGIIGI